MELVCPICNGMVAYLFKCPLCNNQMENKGPIQDYFDEYSPYLAMDITERIDGAPKEKCVHLFYCNNCKSSKQIPIEKFLV